jgi:hypothetical protein
MPYERVHYRQGASVYIRAFSGVVRKLGTAQSVRMCACLGTDCAVLRPVAAATEPSAQRSEVGMCER